MDGCSGPGYGIISAGSDGKYDLLPFRTTDALLSTADALLSTGGKLAQIRYGLQMTKVRKVQVVFAV